MSFRKYLVLVGVMVFGSLGDSFLSRGMKDVGEISLANWTLIFHALLNPWVIAGMLLLGSFFACYSAALSWADLTYVLPATAIGYVVVALLGKFFLHEQISVLRWTGILLIVIGVGYVSRGPALTNKGDAAPSATPEPAEVDA